MVSSFIDPRLSIFVYRNFQGINNPLSLHRVRQAPAQDTSAVFGGEADLHFHPKPIKWLSFESTFSFVTGKQENGVYLPFIPAHKLHFELRAEKENLLSCKKHLFQFLQVQPLIKTILHPTKQPQQVTLY
jgi:hypothetical protein